MSIPNGYRRQYAVLNHSTQMQIAFGLYSESPNLPSAEIMLTWHDLRRNHAPSPRLETFDDAWFALPHVSDVLASLAELPKSSSASMLSPVEAERLLVSLGFDNLNPGRTLL